MADKKQRFALISFFAKVYKQETGKTQVINKYSAQWDADALLESYSISDLNRMINRYVKFSDTPSWKGFAKGAQSVYDSMVEEDEDHEARKIQRQKVKEWLND